MHFTLIIIKGYFVYATCQSATILRLKYCLVIIIVSCLSKLIPQVSRNKTKFDFNEILGVVRINFLSNASYTTQNSSRNHFMIDLNIRKITLLKINLEKYYFKTQFYKNIILGL